MALLRQTTHKDDGYHLSSTEWRSPIEFLFFIGYFPQKSTTIGGFLAECDRTKRHSMRLGHPVHTYVNTLLLLYTYRSVETD